MSSKLEWITTSVWEGKEYPVCSFCGKFFSNLPAGIKLSDPDIEAIAESGAEHLFDEHQDEIIAWYMLSRGR